jgi:hypothetical protein
VNWNLRKAEHALAREDRDEARVFAWNALATTRPEELPILARIAEQLDDELMLLEIQRRGLAEEVEPAPTSRSGTLVRAAGLALLVAAVVLSNR